MVKLCVSGFIRLLVLWMLFHGSCCFVYGQGRLGSLKKRQQQNEKEIEFTNSLLKRTLRSKKTSYHKLLLLNQKIKSREALIHTMEGEISILDNRIVAVNKQVRRFEARLKHLRELYAQSILYASKQRDSYKKLMFLFASQDFNQAYRRVKYLQQYADYSRKQSQEIVSTRDSLNNNIAQLTLTREKKKSLLLRKTSEKKQLGQEKGQHSKMVEQLRSKEKKLRLELDNQKRYALKLQREIQRIIKMEAAKASTSKSGRGKFALTPQEKLLSDQFGKNKGHLPWPTRTGFVSEPFGEHAHPVLKHVKVRNDGINITTDAHASCRSVFSGEVSYVLAMPGLNTVVIIRHGEFFTVYSNITEVSIKKGDKVTAKQIIGKVYTDNNDGQTVLKFQLWKGSSKLNPSQWLSHQ